MLPRMVMGFSVFLLTPLREGRPRCSIWRLESVLFLLTPLREGRRTSR